MGHGRRALLLVLLVGLLSATFGVSPALADDPCLPVDANGDGVVDAPPEPGSGCILVSFVVEPRKSQPVVDLAFHTIHGGFLWTPDFDPARIDDPTLCFGDADTPQNRACVPVTSRCKAINLNADGQPDKICKWWTSEADVHSGDTSACVSGSTLDVPPKKIEACAPLTTINGAAPALAIGDASVAEGDAGSTLASFTVTLSPAASEPVTVSWATADGSATAPEDYGAASGSLAFAQGETTKTIDVAVSGDSDVEPNESFSVVLSSPAGAIIGDGTGVGTIVTDDVVSSLSIGDATVTEGNAGSTLATFTVSLSPASTEPVTVSWATADGSAVAPDDYQADSGSLLFAEGETSKSVSVVVWGDTQIEGAESFFVNLSSASAPIADGQGTGTIADDEVTPSITISNVTMAEGNSGTQPAIFTVTLSAPAGQEVTVAYATVSGTAKPPGDYLTVTGTLTFAPGETSATISVPVVGDTTVERNEGFTVKLTNPTGATIADGTGQCLIQEDDF